MKWMLCACLGVAVLMGPPAPSGRAQAPEPYFDPFPPEVVGKDCGWQSSRTPQHDSALEQRFRQWILGLRPSERRELASNLLFAVHPLMAFLPTEAVAQLPCDHPQQGNVHYQIMPMVLRVVGPNGQETIQVQNATPDRLPCERPIWGFGDSHEPTNGSPAAGGIRIQLDPNQYGVTCPYVVTRDCPAPLPSCNFPDALTNLQRLIQADQLLRHGEELAHTGHFNEAVDCFQTIHCLVPGTNLEARANNATQDVLVRVYGTTTESGLVDEQSEPAKEACPSCDECPHCTKAKAKEACPSCEECEHCTKAKTVAFVVTETHAKPRTIVYPVADLLGKGKDTRSDDLDDLMSLLATTVEPKSWANCGGEGTMESYQRARAIVIRQSPEVHEQILEVLNGLRQSRDQSEIGDDKSHQTPHTGRAVKACNEEDCDEEIVSKKSEWATECVAKKSECTKKSCCSSGRGCCDEQEPSTVLTLPAVPEMPAAGFGLELEVVNDVVPPIKNTITGIQSTVGGTCAEANANASGWRLRWQLPLGPLTVLVRYENQELTLGVGTAGSFETSGTEESENPH